MFLHLPGFLTTKIKQMKSQRTLESWMMVNGRDGDFFYTHKKDRAITAIATYYILLILLYVAIISRLSCCKQTVGKKQIFFN